MDYRKLLKSYIGRVDSCEGVTFIDGYITLKYAAEEDLTEEEEIELIKLCGELDNDNKEEK